MVNAKAEVRNNTSIQYLCGLHWTVLCLGLKFMTA